MEPHLRNGYQWEDIDEWHALLIGPEAYRVAAVIVMDRGDPHLMDSEWRVMSERYPGLNFVEGNTSLEMPEIKRAVLTRLGNELKKQREEIENGVASVLALLLAGKENV